MKAKDVLNILKITRPTLCVYLKKGYIKGKMKVTGQYDYDEDSVFEYAGINERKTVIYARVSTPGQKNSLKNQIDTLTQYANSRGFSVTKVYSDVASGLNFDRGQFQELIQDVIHYRVKNIIISHKDRFSRVSFDMWKQLCSEFYCNIIVMNEDEDDDKGIFSDIISLIHCLSMRMYSSRRKKKIDLVESDLKIMNETE